MNFLLTISLNQNPVDKKVIGVQFEGDSDMPLSAILQGIQIFLNSTEANQKSPGTHTLGDIFPEVGK